MIGAGAVVTKNVPDFALIVGNPGRVIAWVDKKGERLSFDNNGCSLCGNFEMKDSKVSEI